MRHRVKAIRFGQGQDASDMMLRKLVYNFIRKATLTTSEKRAKAVKKYVDIVVHKSKQNTESNRNWLLSFFASSSFVKVLFDQVGPIFKDINGGSVKLSRITSRISDGSQVLKVTWSQPVVLNWGEKKEEKAVAKK